MYQRQNAHGRNGRGVKDWVAEVPTLLMPDVHPKPKKIKGEKMYVGKGKDAGKFYKVDLFDKQFKVTPGKIKPRSYRAPLESRMKERIC